MQLLFRRVLVSTVNWIYIWLPRMTGCHQRADRSFRYWNGRPFPVCARCTGELMGMATAICTVWVGYPPLWVLLVMLLPMVVDGTIQLLTSYESTNGRRLVTGILFGYAFAVLLTESIRVVYCFGVQIGRRYIFVD